MDELSDSTVKTFRWAAQVGVVLTILCVPIACQRTDPRVAPLISQLRSESRDIAAAELAEIGRPAVRPLINALLYEDPEASHRVVTTLGSIGKDAVPALNRALGNASVNVRLGAVQALGLIGPGAKRAVPTLIQMLDDETTIRAAAVTTLTTIGGSAVPELIGALRDRELSSAAKQSIPAVLAEIGEPATDIVAALMQAIEDTDSVLQRAAASSLSHIGQPAIPRMVASVRMKLSSNPLRIIWALGEMGPVAQDAVPALIDVLSDDQNMRAEAAIALGKVGPGARDALPVLTDLISDGSYNVCAAAARAVIRIGQAPGDIMPTLINALASDDPDTSRQAGWAIRAIENPDVNVIPSLVEALQREDLYSSIVRCLRVMGPRAQAATPALVAILRDSSSPERAAVVAALGSIQEPEDIVVPALIDTLDLPHSDAISVVSALRLGNRDQLSGAADDLLVSYTAATALIHLKSHAVPRLMDAVTHKARGKRVLIGYILGRMGEIGEQEAIERSRAMPLTAARSFLRAYNETARRSDSSPLDTSQASSSQEAFRQWAYRTGGVTWMHFESDWQIWVVLSTEKYATGDLQAIAQFLARAYVVQTRFGRDVVVTVWNPSRTKYLAKGWSP
jgi:HEAT repeat protein